MAYSDFSLSQVKKEFALVETTGCLFPQNIALEPSEWLSETLRHSLTLAISSSSEKARSEFIIAPILIEIKRRNSQKIAIHSGERLDIDSDQGLKGECDFILSRGPVSSTIETPIISLVEAKKNDIKIGLGQCVAQMIGAQRFNQAEGNDILTIYGCVTTGEDWQFLMLEDNRVIIDTQRYYINEPQKVLGIFQKIVDGYTLLPEQVAA
ncbi:MAG: hypothetical protein ACFB0D_09625 [Phormidesmis sp.]